MWDTANGRASATSTGPGCTIMAACTPSNAPRSSMYTLPPPPSSAGVPNTVTVSPRSPAVAASARPAPTAAAAMMLCPHACPRAGSASYSAQMPTCSGPVPVLAMNAVGSPQAFVSTSKPASASSAPTQAAAHSSAHATSGWACSRWLRAVSRSRAPVTVPAIVSLTSIRAPLRLSACWAPASPPRMPLGPVMFLPSPAPRPHRGTGRCRRLRPPARPRWRQAAP